MHASRVTFNNVIDATFTALFLQTKRAAFLQRISIFSLVVEVSNIPDQSKDN
jgi:hypothetical protein